MARTEPEAHTAVRAIGRALLCGVGLWAVLALIPGRAGAATDRSDSLPEPAWTTITWRSAGLRLEVPTYGRELERSLSEHSGRIQNYRIEDLRSLSDGFYEYRPGDYFLELKIEREGESTGFPAEDCARPPRQVGGYPGSRWCRIGESVELGGEASSTHIAEIPHEGVVLRLSLDASALPEPDARRIVESVHWLAEPCLDGSSDGSSDESSEASRGPGATARRRR